MQKQSYVWHRNLQTQSPATCQKPVCARCPIGTVWAVSYSKICVTMAQKRSLGRTL